MSVLITSESAPSLKPMADGLVRRYKNAGVPPPKVIYTDRDCCSDFGSSKYSVLFEDWSKELHVRLDIWHFMRRIAGGVTSESHPLYGTLMARLSTAIFEWDMGDYTKLLEAKRGELVALGITNPSERAIRKAITKEELMKHCRRRTRGVEETTKTIEQLLLSPNRHTWSSSSQGRNKVHLGRTEEAPSMHSRPPWHFPVHHCWLPGERESTPPNPPMCQRLYITGELPPSPRQVYTRYLCQCSELSSLSP